MADKLKSGFISLIGRPNVGKSTLINQLIGEKIAIVSDKPQTTRNQIKGVLTTEQGQAIFLDTPGLHKPGSKLSSNLVKSACTTFREVDLIFFLVDACSGLGLGDKFIIELLKEVKTPVFLLLNKIDKVHPDDLLVLIDKYRQLGDFKEFIPVSALKGNNLSKLLQIMWSYLKEGPQYYPSDQISDVSERFLIQEIIREKVLLLTKEEIPHSVAVVVEQLQNRDDESNIIDIDAVIYAERESQKGILIGKKGSLLKQVGQRARIELESLFGNRIFLRLWVKVSKDWRNKEGKLREFGYDLDI